MAAVTTPLGPARCYDCLSDDVAVKVVDLAGFEHWFCAEDWAAETAFADRLRELLDGARAELERELGIRS